MARQADNTLPPPLTLHNLVQKLLRPHIVLRVRLAMIRPPQQILLTKPLLNRPSRVRSMNNAPRTATVARMLAHNLASQFLNRRLKRIEPQILPLELRGPQTPHQRASNPSVRHGHFLRLELLREELAGVSRLLLADRCEVRVYPVQRAVAVQLAPVVVPGLRAVEGFGDVVLAFAVAGEVEEFVGRGGRGGGDEVLQVRGEELPLGFGGVC